MWVQVCYAHKPHILVVFHRNIFTVRCWLQGFKCDLYQLAKLLCFQKDDSQVTDDVSYNSGGDFSSHEADLVLGN